MDTDDHQPDPTPQAQPVQPLPPELPPSGDATPQPLASASSDSGATGHDNLTAPSSDETMMAVLCHVLTLVSSFVGPLIVWLVKRDDSDFVDDQGAEVLNFQITVLVAGVPLSVLLCIPVVNFLAAFGLLALGACAFVFPIIAAVKASEGKRYRYPLTLRLISPRRR